MMIARLAGARSSNESAAREGEENMMGGFRKTEAWSPKCQVFDETRRFLADEPSDDSM